MHILYIILHLHAMRHAHAVGKVDSRAESPDEITLPFARRESMMISQSPHRVVFFCRGATCGHVVGP